MSGLSVAGRRGPAARLRSSLDGPRRLGLIDGLAGTAIALAVWQVLSVTKVLDPVAIPSMAGAVRTAFSSLGTGQLWAGVGQTFEGMALGFVAGSAGGILVGTVVGLSKTAYASCFLIIEFFKTIPVIAILPLAVVLFGTTTQMKVLLISFGLFFPMLVQTVYGVQSVDPVIRDTARVFRLGPVRRFIWVTMPSAAPYIATGLRLGVTGALLLDIIAEITAGGSGIGLQILQAQSADAISYTYGLLLITGCIGVALVVGVTALERRVLAWHEVYRTA